MLEKLLLAVDQSEHSRTAIPATVQLVDGIVGEVKAAGVTGEGAVRRTPAGPRPVLSSSTPVRWAQTRFQS